MKDFVSVTKVSVKTKHQKRLLLLNIKELFLEFKKEYPTVKIGFSKFCELRPKCMETVNHSGMHSLLFMSVSPKRQTISISYSRQF